MNRTIVNPAGTPQTGAPLSPAVRVGCLVFVSGQLPIDPETGSFPAGIEAQTRASLANLAAVLEAAGANLASVAKTTVFLKNMDDFVAMNAVYAQYFPSEPPARSAVEVARLPRDAMVEIEAIALVREPMKP